MSNWVLDCYTKLEFITLFKSMWERDIFADFGLITFK